MTVADLNDRITRVLAAALGVAIVVAVVLMARPAGGHGGVMPASLRFAASPDGAIAVAPAAPRSLLEADHLRPGDHVAGALVLRNQTGERLPVALRAEPSSTILDGITRVRIEAGGRNVFDSTLQALREGSDPIRIAPGGTVTARVSAWIPAAEATGYEGRHVDVMLVPEEGPG
jgi:hypothetical protein